VKNVEKCGKMWKKVEKSEKVEKCGKKWKKVKR
jgi:hypothetical protein